MGSARNAALGYLYDVWCALRQGVRTQGDLYLVPPRSKTFQNAVSAVGGWLKPPAGLLLVDDPGWSTRPIAEPAPSPYSASVICLFDGGYNVTYRRDC